MPPEYVGPCVKDLGGAKQPVFPTFVDAAAAAGSVINLNVGGYSNVMVYQ